jgi:type VI protein secretion system component VasF
MSRRTIQIVAAINVLACGSLFVWFRLIPDPPGRVSQAIENMLDETPRQYDRESRRELNQLAAQFRETRKTRLQHLYYWSLAAGACVLMNTGVWFWQLVQVEREGASAGTQPPAGGEISSADSTGEP